MSFIVGILTVFLVLNCALLILLVLIQLPKKDAGAGLAFGGGAADALFGAGSGNVLTKVTKYAAVIFFVLALFLGYLQDQVHKNSSARSLKSRCSKNKCKRPVCHATAGYAASLPTGNAPRFPTGGCAGKQFADRARVRANQCSRRRRRNRNNAMAIFQRARRIFSRARFCFLRAVFSCLAASLCFPAASATSRRPTSPSSMAPNRNRWIRPSSPARPKSASSWVCLKD